MNLLSPPDPRFERIEKLERELELMKNGRKWQTAALWALFILLIVFAGGAIAYNYKSSDDLRRDTSSDRNVLGKRIDDSWSNAQSRLDSKTESLDGRTNLLVQDVASLSAENAALRAKFEAFEQYCGGSCVPPTK